MKFNIKLKRKNNLKGNISILIIFVLLISGLIGILTMNFVKDMLGYTGDFYHYNKAYYYSNAGLELALTEIDNAGIGFSNEVNSADNIFIDNFECSNCTLEMDVEGKTQYLSDKFWLSDECTDDNAFVLQQGGSVVLPLFTQENLSTNAEILSDQEIIYDKNIMKHVDKFIFVNNQNFVKKFNIGLFVLLGNDIQKDLLYIKEYDGTENMIADYFGEYKNYYQGENILENENYFMYLVISNIESSEGSFCIHMDDITYTHGGGDYMELATMNFFVNSLATYGDKEVGLRAIYRQPIPDFLINSFNQSVE